MTSRPAFLLLAVLAAGALTGARGGDDLQNSGGAASAPAMLYPVRLVHKPVLVRPKRVLPTAGPGPVHVAPPKPPSPYVCPDGADPNLPCGTPITHSAPGYTSCTFLNGIQLGCDIYPMPTGSPVGGEQPGGHNHHQQD